MTNGLRRWHLVKILQHRRVTWTVVAVFVVTLLGVGSAFLVDWRWGAVALVLYLITFTVGLFQFRNVIAETENYVNDLAYQIQRGQQEALLEMPIGLILLDEEGIVKWINPYMAKYFLLRLVVGQKLSEVDEELAKLVEAAGDQEESHLVTWQERQFQLLYQARFHTIYLLDVTDYEQINQRYHDEQLFIGNIYLDNFIELTQGMSDSAVSNLHNYVTSELSKWADANQLLLKVIDDDNYLLFGHQQSLRGLEDDQFKILDTIRENTSKMNSPVTLSVGIADGEANLTKLADLAQRNLDLALGRGGDQVVVKDNEQPARFYGGKTNPMEKRTRVRARMISQALQELLTAADQVFVVGHQKPDMDSMGACLGIRRISEMNDQPCYVVFDSDHLHSDMERLMDQLHDYKQIDSRIITPERALELATDQSLLVMVDHSKVSMSMAPQLYERLANRTVIIDHHRRGEEFPENPLLVYIEPYASSTCELITEMFEYQPREGRALNQLEATVMLAGIQIDTQSFTRNAGTRTFDAASYLRSAGADGRLTQEFMKENRANFMERNHLISNANFIGDKIALCVGEEDRTYDPVTTAQAADMLLDVEGVEASFAITRRSSEVVGISARSGGDFNVQLVMEELGGGGHLNNAAAQVKDQPIEAVVSRLKAVLAPPTTTDGNPKEETK